MAQNAALLGDLARSLGAAPPARRDDMLVRITDLFNGVSHLLPDAGLETFDAIFVSLIPACSERARAHLSGAIAANPRAPRKAIRHLAFDDAIMVAKPVIRLSPLLLDDHLLALATVKSPEHLLAICERASVGSAVTDIILSRANGDIMVALVSNPGAALSDKGKGLLAEAALYDGGLYDLAMTRADMSATLTDLETALSPAPVLAQPRPAITSAPDPGLSDLDHEIRDLLADGKVDAALSILATRLSVPVSAIAKAFALDAHGGFLAYARAVPLAWDTTLRFLTRRYEKGQIVPRLQRAEADYRKLQVADARRVATLLGQHADNPH